MNTRIRLLSLLLTLPALPASAAIASEPAPATLPATRPLMLDPAQIEAAADAVARDQVRHEPGPGMTIAVASNGDILFAKSYGKADVEMDVDASADTFYRIGSISKQFTAAAVMRLVEQGKLSLDDPIEKHLPDYPTQGHHVTLRHLLNHTSGIRNYTGLDEADREREFRLDLTYEEMVELFGHHPFDFAPGERFEYNNSAYWLLGEIIGRVAGVPYEQYIEQELLAPLGLHETRHAGERPIIPNRAEAYQLEDGQFVNAPYFSATFAGAGGSLGSTARDLVRWTHLLHGGQVVSAESLRQMTTRTQLPDDRSIGYGFGLGLHQQRHDRRAIVHGGGIGGFRGLLCHYPEEGLTITVLANTRAVEPSVVEAALVRTIFGIEVTDLPLTAEDIARYEGTYVLQWGDRTRELRVFGEDGHLRSQLPGSPGTRLRYLGDHGFVPVVEETMRVVFEFEDDKAHAVTLRSGENEIRGRRKE